MKTISILSAVLSPAAAAIVIGIALLQSGKITMNGFAFILIGGIVVSMVNAVITGMRAAKK